MDEQKLAAMFRQARAADNMHVPPVRAIIARAEYAKELQARRRFTRVVEIFSGLVGAGISAMILLAPRGLPLPMSPWIVPVLVLGGIVILWATTETPGHTAQKIGG
jgi:hypothetical protein